MAPAGASPVTRIAFAEASASTIQKISVGVDH